MNKGFHKSKWTDQEMGFVDGQGSLIIMVSLGERSYNFWLSLEQKNKVRLADRVDGIPLGLRVTSVLTPS